MKSCDLHQLVPQKSHDTLEQITVLYIINTKQFIVSYQMMGAEFLQGLRTFATLRNKVYIPLSKRYFAN